MKHKDLLRHIGDFFKFKSKVIECEDCPHPIEEPNVLHDGQEDVEQAVVSVSESPLKTLFLIGTEFLTYCYPVDTECIKEILKTDGVIGPDYYKTVPDAIKNLEDYDNEWFCDEKHKEVCAQLVSDLYLLAERYGYAGAYTLIASLKRRHGALMELMKRAADLGNKEGMVSYGMFLALHHDVENGFLWIKKGAEAGCEVGSLIVAISNHFGTFTDINLEEAVSWYKRVLADKVNYIAANNLGVIYADAGCFHTAMKYFEMAQSCKDEYKEEIFDLSKDSLDNFETCKTLLSFPYKQRRKRCVIQFIGPQLEGMFCWDPLQDKQKAPLPVHNFERNAISEPFVPQEADLEMADVEDLKENQGLCLSYSPSNVKYKYDNFIFPYYEVEVRNPEIFGNRHELVFLEKYAHAELNQYIQKHLGQLRAIFKRCGYLFTYLPAHIEDSCDTEDMLGSFMESFESFMRRRERKESMYWDYLFSNEQLPDDATGFLLLSPRNEAHETHYRYIMFPYRPGTDWQRAFLEFAYHLSNGYVGKKKEEDDGEQRYKILIDSQYGVFLCDAEGNKLTEVKMPALSKALYFVYLKHPEGIAIKELMDYKEELMFYYQKVSNRSCNEKSIDDLVNPIKNSANEKLSRIKKAIEVSFSTYEGDPYPFVPTGSKGEKYRVRIEPSDVIWKDEEC